MADYTATPNPSSTTVINGTTEGINPGDSIFLTNGTYLNFRFEEVQGTALNPITIVNQGGLATITGDGGSLGMWFIDCQYINFFAVPAGSNSFGVLINDRTHVARLCNNIAFRDLEYVATGSSHPTAFHIVQDGSITTPISYITFERCNVSNGPSLAGFYLGDTRGGSPASNEYLINNITVRNCTIEGPGDGIQLESCTAGGLIENNRLSNIRPETLGSAPRKGAITINVGTSNCIVRNNFVEDSESVGILYNPSSWSSLTAPGGNEILIEGNVCRNCGTVTATGQNAGIRIYNIAHDSVIVRNNTVVGSFEGIYSSLATAVLDSNIVVDNTTGLIVTGSETITNNLTQQSAYSFDGQIYAIGDILFYDQANLDYRLLPASPALVANSPSLTSVAGYAGAYDAVPIVAQQIRESIPVGMFQKT